MIKYNSGSYGFSILFRFHGSAVFKSLLPSLISSVIYLVLDNTVDLQEEGNVLFLHPYPMGALISALTFLLAFRANFSYNRYWESITAVHQMHSKWLDVGMELGAFHLQSSVYDRVKPPAFGAHPEFNSLERARERLNELTLEELETKLEAMEQDDAIDEVMRPTPTKLRSFLRRRRRKEKEAAPEPKKELSPKHQSIPPARKARAFVTKSINAVAPPPAAHQQTGELRIFQNFTDWLTNKPKVDNATEEPISETIVVQAVPGNGVRAWDRDKPPLFLQEAAHLLSLLSAVAFSTLRNDLEQADSPLIPFTPGAPWPNVDPDAEGTEIRNFLTQHRSIAVFRYIIGCSRTPAARTLYNAARPFRVIGGVSDDEIELLQAARGPLAKVALVTMWLQEFISREYLAGATGAVAPPIISRLYQFTSDGMLGYNQARKIAYIPFPFPHAQITSLFVLVVVGLIPVLMLSYVTNEPFGFVLNMLVVMSFSGLHEVARELENPFQNVPNDVPLNNFQAQFNEGLLQMFAGYHPDAYWEVVEKKEDDSPPASSSAEEAKRGNMQTLREESAEEDEEERSDAVESNTLEDDVELGEEKV